MLNSVARLVDDHLKAWAALAQAATDVFQLPVRSAQRLLDPDAPPLADPLAVAVAQIAQIDDDLARARGQVAGLEARLRELSEAHAVQVDQLRTAYARLELEARDGSVRALDDQKLAIYKLLEPLLMQLPIVRHAVEQGRTVEVTDLLDLLGPLDEALASLGFTRIGNIGAEVAFDPARHQAVGGSPDFGSPVAVKHPGWALDDRILRRARVRLPS
jgi:molecular chaperone GrpE (heat shock protein)